MILKNKYPICEFDTGKNPIIQAANFLTKSLPVFTVAEYKEYANTQIRKLTSNEVQKYMSE